jgi:hypothetical protein
MKEQKLTLEIPYYSRSVQGIIWDFTTFCELNSINFKIKLCPEFEKGILGKGSFARLNYRGNKILIDLQDNPIPYDFYSEYDVIFKRSFSKHLKYPPNVFPFGLRFDVFGGIWVVLISNFRAFILDKRNRKELIRTLLNFMGFDHMGFNNLSRRWVNLNIESNNNKGNDMTEKKVFFSTRLWDKSKTGEKISIERQEIFKILKNRKDTCFNSLVPMKQSLYLKKLSESNVVIINNGVHDVPGVRLPELLLIGKIVLTTELNVVIPHLDKYNCLLYYDLENLNQMINALDIEKMNDIKKNTQKYTQENLGPAKRFEYIFNTININQYKRLT